MPIYDTLYMVVSRDQNAGRSHNIGIDNISFERAEQFRCLGTALTDQNSSQEEIMSRLKSENAYCLSVQNILPSSLPYKNIKNKTYKTIILFCFGVKHRRSHWGRNVS